MALLCLLGATAAAQMGDSTRLPRWNHELGFFAGYSPDSDAFIGQSLKRKFFELNGQYAWTFWTPRSFAVKWVTEVTPVALISDPDLYYFYKKNTPPLFIPAATTYGAGVTPLGMQVNFLNGHRVQPFVDSHGGFLIFTRAEPVPLARKFNFTFNFGAGVQVMAWQRSSLLVGYKYHHISNDETATENPGVDNSEVYVGWLWRWQRHK